MPTVPGLDNVFKGQAFHASNYRGGVEFAKKNVVVIGAGNSSADICQDLYHCGAATVTMVQRSSTCVVSVSTTVHSLDHAWPDGVLVEVSDFKVTSLPFLLMKGLLKKRPQSFWAAETALHERLRHVGLNVDLGPDGLGHFPLLIYGRGGGKNPAHALFKRH